ncbi:hypothetical protein N7495_006837 [Penicillium taxi]|uniref:uncharacterized protein n=1 Tax=Penicillium taxi TaxID=168475 RepID=UPI002545935E|nr:uncharacterized protein N7495_006837 [Penicillium taxi]KAJ5895146.1 hypothetical protein N7495_006837 [Penicillium taxi]
MDLRTIMNSDAGASNPPPTSQSSSPISDPSLKQRAQSHSDYLGRPQPPIPQPHHTSPELSSPYGPPAQSPYQKFNAGPPPLNTSVGSQRSQSPSQVSTPYGPGPRDVYGASTFNSQHSAGPLTSPYTSQQPTGESQSYFAQQRSHSLQTVMTNPSRPIVESPPSAPQARPHHFSPPSTHRLSIPGTPLGPHPAFSSIQSTLQSPSSVYPLSSGRDSPRHLLSSPRPLFDPHPRDATQTQSPVTQRTFSPSSRPSKSTSQFHPSVSKEDTSTSSTKGNSHQNNSIAAAVAPSLSPAEKKGIETYTMPINSAPALDSQIISSPSVSRGGSHPLKMEVDNESGPQLESQPKRKRRRFNEPPIFAQRSVRVKGKCPIIQNPQPTVSKAARRLDPDPWASRRSSMAAASSVPAASSRPSQTLNAATPESSPYSAPPNANDPSAASAPFVPPPSVPGGLGPWEPSITGKIPYEEITKTVSDFLFQLVVMRNDGPSGVVEIEAKLGHLMDLERGERLNLPIFTEAVVNNSRARTSFQSNMTVEQHRAMNNFLNETVKASIPSNNANRIPISYAHKKERDTFYSVNPEELPPLIRQNLNRRHSPKVRVTRDLRSGKVLAKIVKCRLADIDVSSPKTHVDWRISVNLEMEYEGEIGDELPQEGVKGSQGERIKDRMSYRHLAYQVDLTQVAKANSPKGEFEHELELEVSADEIRRQGKLAMAGDSTNQYEELVKGFVDNIRVLARAVPDPDEPFPAS